MQVNTVGGTTAPAAAGSRDVFGKDAFMKLLLAQLTHPDPFAPQDATAFMNQIVQFGVLERLIELEERVRELNRSQVLGQAAALIGREVVVQAGDTRIAGVVEKVTLTADGAAVVVNGTAYDFNTVAEVR
ncbi:MAG: flagellar hook capping FlgD N-terminal domain-containing protein [Bacillota bacterium]